MWAGQTPTGMLPSSSSPTTQTRKSGSQQPEPESPASVGIPSLEVGERVRVVDGKTPDRTGRITFVGQTDLSQGGTWVGLELDEGLLGKHNGTVEGKTYFKCEADRGLLVAEHKVRREDGSPIRSPPPRNSMSSGTPTITFSYSSKSKRRTTPTSNNKSRPDSASSKKQSPNRRFSSSDSARTGSRGGGASTEVEALALAAERRALRAEMDELASTKRMVEAERAALAAEMDELASTKRMVEAERAALAALETATPLSPRPLPPLPSPLEVPKVVERKDTLASVQRCIEQLISALGGTADAEETDQSALGPVLETLLKSVLIRVDKCETLLAKQQQQRVLTTPRPAAAFSPSPSKGGNTTDDDFY
eukprot:gene7258-20961_t